jgi:hypothetical protein
VIQEKLVDTRQEECRTLEYGFKSEDP